jgi:hypothetical protein
LNKEVDTDIGRGRKRTEEETGKNVNTLEGTNNTGITEGKGGMV